MRDGAGTLRHYLLLVKNAIRSRTAASPRVAASPTGMIEVAAGPNLLNLCAGDHGRFRVGIGDANRQRALGPHDPDEDLSVLGRDRVRRVVRLDDRARRGDVAVDVGTAFPADLGQIGPDLAPLPPKRVALRAPGLLAREKRLAPRGVSAGEVGNDQGRRRRLRPAARVPRARSIAVASASCRSCPRPCGMTP